LASNAQAYTLRELDAALDGSGLSRAIFEPDLCFFSFAHGFSKPDPHVFRLLTARLRARGIPPHETLMVGDRLDNDIAPARTQGWQTWQLKSPPEPGAGPGGDWAALAAAYGWS
jgi:FMN phosphatase YigB (HAD superfamily)